MDNAANLANLKEASNQHNNVAYGQDTDQDNAVFENAINYMNSYAFTVAVFNTLTDIEKLYCFEFMTDSDKFIEFIEFVFKTQKIRLEFIKKIDITKIKNWVNSTAFTTDIFKVLAMDVKIYIILLFNSSRAIEYLLKNQNDITNFKNNCENFKQDNEYDPFPEDTIYNLYPFLILRALKGSKTFFKYIIESNAKSIKKLFSFLQTRPRINLILKLIKSMINIHRIPGKHQPGVMIVKSLEKKHSLQKKIDNPNIYQMLEPFIVSHYNSYLKSNEQFQKLIELSKHITTYLNNPINEDSLNKLDANVKNRRRELKLSGNSGYTEDAHNQEHGVQVSNSAAFRRCRIILIEDDQIMKYYKTTVNNITPIDRASKSDASNSHFGEVLLNARLGKPSLSPILPPSNHLQAIGRSNAGVRPDSNDPPPEFMLY